MGVGEFDGKSITAYRNYFSSYAERFSRRPAGGENLLDVKKRVGDFLEYLEKTYTNTTILMVTHEDAAWQLWSAAFGWSDEEAIDAKKKREEGNFIANAEIRLLPYTPMPRNGNYELDAHRPFIDAVALVCRCGGAMKRIPDVFDCWFESGSMPFAQFHYPFENQKLFKKNFPAHFIAEGLDQTRGWFYTLLVLSLGLFGKSAFRSVVVNGLILAEDGQKMSKKLKNYPDPVAVIDTYGSDALRYYFLSSPLVRGEDLNFSEKDVQETMNKIVARIRNVCAFYELHRGDVPPSPQTNKAPRAKHVLDRWILIKLFELINKVTYAMERYELDKAVRPIGDFIEDVSVWYIRRSRERFKGSDTEDGKSAIATTRFVLLELSKIMAPFTPFVAEELYKNVNLSKDDESVHLLSWPKEDPAIPVWPNPMALLHRLFGTHEDLRVLSDMARVREIVSLALEARQKTGIKVRQPLSELRVKKKESRIKDNEQLVALIKDEINVKQVLFGADISEDVVLDTVVTAELRREGNFRELMRHIQDLRKNAGLLPSQSVRITIDTEESGRAFIKSFEQELKKSASISAISFGNASGERYLLDGLSFGIELKNDTR